MKKSYFKEIVILILLLILIMLILAVALYDFVPTNVNIPETISYTPDSKTTSIKQEIAYTNGGDVTPDQTETELVTSLKSYSINASDLTVYGQKNLYNSGNSNPFDYAEEAPANPPAEGNPTQTPSGSNTTNTNTNSAGQTGTATNTNTNNSATGTFFEKPNSK